MSRAFRYSSACGLMLALAIPWPALALDAHVQSATQDDKPLTFLQQCGYGIVTAAPSNQHQPVAKGERFSVEGTAWPTAAQASWSKLQSGFARTQSAAIPRRAGHSICILLCRFLI